MSAVDLRCDPAMLTDLPKIIQAVSDTRRAFGRAFTNGMPEIVLMIDPADGQRLLHEAYASDSFTLFDGRGERHQVVVHPDGSEWMEVSVMGVKVRWPANRIALRSGGYVRV